VASLVDAIPGLVFAGNQIRRRRQPSRDPHAVSVAWVSMRCSSEFRVASGLGQYAAIDDVPRPIYC
jgi:hypothetical protein